jgi:hypothetical protein
MPIFIAVGLFFAGMFHSIQADKPKQMLLTIDGQNKLAVVQPYHKAVKSVNYNAVGSGGFYQDVYGEWQVKK